MAIQQVTLARTRYSSAYCSINRMLELHLSRCRSGPLCLTLYGILQYFSMRFRWYFRGTFQPQNKVLWLGFGRREG